MRTRVPPGPPHRSVYYISFLAYVRLHRLRIPEGVLGWDGRLDDKLSRTKETSRECPALVIDEEAYPLGDL
jgi:hypothetical protein